MLSVDGASNIKGNGARIVLEGPGDIVIDQALKFGFTVNKNWKEYEALIFGTILILEMGATKLKAKSDSQLVANQVSG